MRSTPLTETPRVFGMSPRPLMTSACRRSPLEGASHSPRLRSAPPAQRAPPRAPPPVEPEVGADLQTGLAISPRLRSRDTSRVAQRVRASKAPVVRVPLLD